MVSPGCNVTTFCALFFAFFPWYSADWFPSVFSLGLTRILRSVKVRLEAAVYPVYSGSRVNRFILPLWIKLIRLSNKLLDNSENRS
ncbi:hypothetical protein DC28_14610 [Spirochaeta lutea]|uniref:Uncharacterized protein n=1 Tax=Spirochaeta lutea TaxID=1480694 RepID=A0A098QT39_9SPIO|nr:hypothetical protein DC28_14610 [Spirochaeta lutea]